MRWTLAAAAVLAAGAVYELVLALGWVEIGRQPGADAPGAGTVFVAALIAMVVGAVAAVWRTSSLLAPAAALFVFAFEHTFDPYYAPGRRRYTDGIVAPWLVIVLLALSLVPAVLARRHSVLTTACLAVLALVLLVMPAGH